MEAALVVLPEAAPKRELRRKCRRLLEIILRGTASLLAKKMPRTEYAIELLIKRIPRNTLVCVRYNNDDNNYAGGLTRSGQLFMER